MHKLVILVEQLDDWSAFEEAWPGFLSHAERMPGLLRESTSRVDYILAGSRKFALMHELYFDSQKAAQQAMGSEHGKEAGRALQTMTRGRVSLFLADHKEDDLENIRKYQSGAPAEETPPGA
jgi:uncharacterized protein (TIGR02118 family)